MAANIWVLTWPKKRLKSLDRELSLKGKKLKEDDAYKKMMTGDQRKTPNAR